MANELDEVTGPTAAEGRDVAVIARQIPAQVGVGSTLFEVALWTVGTIPGIVLLATEAGPTLQALGLAVAGLLPGLIFLFLKINALTYLRQLQQRIQAHASEIDNYLEQRVVILQNVAQLVDKAIDLDKSVMQAIAAARAGRIGSDADRNAQAQQLDGLLARLNVVVEGYPELRAHAAIADAMRQNSYLQKEITAARTLYNDTVAIWNQDIFAWPTKAIVAARQGYTTRIPFTASSETKAKARGTFF